MLQYSIEYNTKINSINVAVITVNTQGSILMSPLASYKNVTLREDGINERVYINDSNDSTKEYLSLPLINTAIKKTY